MATIVKCIYEKGHFRPLEKIDVKGKKGIFAELAKKKNKNFQKLLEEAYIATAKESLKIAKEWEVLD